MRTKEEIKGHPGFSALITKAKALDFESRERLVKMFKNEEDIPFLSGAEEGVIFNVLKEITFPFIFLLILLYM